MKIVMLWTTGDGCTWSSDNVRPIEYESPEAALVDFEARLHVANAANAANKRGGYCEGGYCEFEFCGRTYSPYDFRDSLPDFLTVDEWFEREA